MLKTAAWLAVAALQVVAEFQGVPSFVMTMILRGMRRAIQEPERSHFATFFSGKEEWKKLVNYSDPKSAYVVLADGVWPGNSKASYLVLTSHL